MKKIEDMMNHYSLKDGDHLIPDEPLNREEKERLLNKTLVKAGLSASDSGTQPLAGRAATAKPAGRKSGRKSGRRVWAIAAACILVFAITTVSFAAIALDKNFFDFFNAKEQDQIDMLGSLGTLIDKQVTENDLTIDVKEAVGDGNSVNVLFDIIAPEGTVLDASYYAFSSAYIDLPGSGIGSAGYYIEQLPDENPADNKLTMMICYESEKNLSGKTMRLHFEDLTTPKSTEELDAIEALPPRDEPGTPGDAYDMDKVIVSGSWEIEFPLNYKDASTTIKPNLEVELFGGTCKIKQVRYSPISVTIVAKGSPIVKHDSAPPAMPGDGTSDVVTIDLQGSESEGDGTYGTTDQEITVTLKDGTTVSTNGTSTSTSGDRYTVTCQFAEIINPANITSITFAGAVIPVS